jgi:hypothetical protein
MVRQKSPVAGASYAGVWELPGTGISKPAIGGRYQPG